VLSLHISDGITLGGSNDMSGAAMAVILDRLLGLGYFPDGFEQHKGFRIYRYNK